MCRVFVTFFVGLLLICPLIAVKGYNVRRLNLTITESHYQNGSSIDSFPQLSLSTVRFFPDEDSCSACIRVHARITWNVTDPHRTLSIYFHFLNGLRKSLSIKRLRNHRVQWEDHVGDGVNKGRAQIKCPHLPDNRHSPLILWELVYDCVKAEAGQTMYVSFSRYTGPRISYTVENVCPDLVPSFNLSVDKLSRSFTVTVEMGNRVNSRLCYKKTLAECTNITPGITEIDPSVSLSASLSFPFLLPCVCVQVYYTHRDAARVLRCPFLNGSAFGRDVWRSSESSLYGDTGSSLGWSSVCPPAYLQPSASLCWLEQERSSLCIPVCNSTLEVTVGRRDLKYNTSAVDKHPQMCVQFSFHGSHDVQCPFQPALSRWEVSVSPGWRSLRVHITSSVPASFSAQFCILEEGGAVVRGPVLSVNMGDGARESYMNLPLAFLTDGLCVQVWQSDPAHLGRRILCPDYSHKRFGLLVVAALTILVTTAILGSYIYHAIKKGVADWLSIQTPVLLVSSSGQSAHVAAVCALASLLQGELSAAVRMALWAQGSGAGQTESGPASGPGVADLGPVPWLYGQWEATLVAGGKVLITWSPEAKTAYKLWEKESRRAEGREGKIGDCTREEERPGEEAAGDPGSGVFCEEREAASSSSVTGPVFRAALSCLRGAAQKRGGEHGCVLVRFRGLCPGWDVPRDLQGVPRYCLPQDFRGLVQELKGTGGAGGGTTAAADAAAQRWRCWPGLLSKALSLWSARRLSRRLSAWLPQKAARSKRRERPGRKPSQEVMSETRTEQEKEPLGGLHP